MRIDRRLAEEILFEEAERASEEASPERERWEELIEAFSEACEGTSQTHIAFLGTAILAKATTLEADVFAVKANADTPGAFSARGLGHNVLVPNAPRLGIDLGVSGREPLNNQPYFRVRRATQETLLPLVRDPVPIHAMLEVLECLSGVSSTEEARLALRAYIAVRRRYLPEYPTAPEEVDGERFLSDFARLIREFVNKDSEGGRRAQAVAAGLLDSVFGKDRVVTGRVNDPDRHLPGDVGIQGSEGNGWVRVVEVRDKAVTESDLILLAHKGGQEGVPRVGCLAVAEGQPALDAAPARAWALQRGVVLAVFVGWPSFLDACIFWSEELTPSDFVANAMRTVFERLIELEVSPGGVSAWKDLQAEVG